MQTVTMKGHFLSIFTFKLRFDQENRAQLFSFYIVLMSIGIKSIQSEKLTGNRLCHHVNRVLPIFVSSPRPHRCSAGFFCCKVLVI